MSKTLTEIAQQLKDANKKVQLIYAFNGSGKTRLSREFKEIIVPKNNSNDAEQSDLPRSKILYYSAFTEDLFYWDNDLDGDAERILRIQPNSFTNWLLLLLKDQGQDGNIIRYFQHYTNSKLMPRFSEDLSSVSFSIERGGDDSLRNIKISKGEESNFIWSFFYTLLDYVINVLNVVESNERETKEFDQVEYVFIDDPVSSLDDNHLIELAIDLSRLIKSSNFKNLKFIITTHNPLFYNVLYNEFSRASKYFLKKHDDGNFDLVVQQNDSPFSYHLYLKSELKKASETGEINKYHFNFLRNLLEKTSTFLGYEEWGELLPVPVEPLDSDQKKENPYARIINFYNHAKHAGDEITEVKDDHKRVFKFLVTEIDKLYQVKR